MRVGEGTNQGGGDIPIDHRHAVLWASPVVLLRVAVEKFLTQPILFVVLVDPDPAHESVPHDRVHPGILDGGSGEPRTVPVDRLERGVNEKRRFLARALLSGLDEE